MGRRITHSAWYTLAAALSAVASAGTPAAGGTEPQIEIAEGRLVGVRLSDGGTLFGGIPYAQAPIGEKRWKPPVAVGGWAGVRSATAFGQTCPQPDLGWNAWDAAHSGEDCLNLNVWTPAERTRRLPVMVWFHGGAFLGGSGSAPIYDARALTARGVIVVTVNYRLGVLGFLAHPDLSAASPDKSSGNYGLLDQIVALQWVNRNIRKFGGDPRNVTIFGQSAGSISVANLLSAPTARPFFRRAILQSGTPFGIGELDTAEQAERANAGFGPIADLRSLPADEVMSRWAAYAAASPETRRAVPVIGGAALPRAPRDVFLSGALRGIPLLIGSVAREIPPTSRAELDRTAHRLLGPKADVALAQAREGTADPVLGEPDTQLMTDLSFRCGTLIAARASDRAWLFHFMENFPGRSAPSHSAEVFYVFGTASKATKNKPDISPDQQQLGADMRAYWTNFARRGDPNGPGLTPWRNYSEGESYLEMRAGRVAGRQHLRGAACRPMLEQWTAGTH